MPRPSQTGNKGAVLECKSQHAIFLHTFFNAMNDVWFYVKFLWGSLSRPSVLFKGEKKNFSVLRTVNYMLWNKYGGTALDEKRIPIIVLIYVLYLQGVD